MTETLDEIQQAIDSAKLDSAEAVDQFRIAFLSKKQGRVTSQLKRIPEIEPSDRKAFGQRVNELKALAEGRITAAQTSLSTSTGSDRGIDVTLPGRRPLYGSTHPITQTRAAIIEIFGRYGFSVADGPEIEDEWHNFSALNFPPDHPARDMQDTLFVEESTDGNDGIVLRTHTSPVQVRVMKDSEPPIRVIVPGRVFRNEAISYKSYCLFHQVEGLYVDEGVSLADLKQILHAFAQAIFGDDVKMRFRPSFFPFTEPSAEVDIWWADPGLPEGGRWMEILGCGMVDPNVLEAVNIDSERYTGYAFGMGIDRIAMLRHGISDIRVLFENDIRFLAQF